MKKLSLGFLSIYILVTLFNLGGSPVAHAAGLGSLQNPTSYNAAGSFYYGTFTGDFNGDGYPDYAGVNANPNKSVQVWVNDGTGLYTLQTTVGLSPNNPTSVALGNYDGDSYIDMAIVESAQNRLVIRQGSSGLNFFGSTTNISLSNNPSTVTQADVNGDSKLDLIIGFTNASYVAVLLGDGSGGFGSPSNYSVPETGDSVISVGQVNPGTDSYPDIIATGGGTNLNVLLGNGDGSFQSATSYTTGYGANGVAVADFNGDGAADLAVSDTNQQRVDVFINNGSGVYGSPTYISFPSAYPQGIAAGLINSGSNVDLVVALASADNIAVILGNGDGTFNAPTLFTSGAYPNHVSLADVNLDGALDVLAAQQNSPYGFTVNLGVPATVTNSATVTASVDPTISFSIRTSDDSTTTNSCGFGTLSTGLVKTCAYRLAIGTNATNGFNTQVVSDGAFRNASDTIANISSAGTVTAGTEGYGVAVTGATGLTVDSAFATNDNPLPLSAGSIISTTNPFLYTQNTLTTSTLVTHKAAISPVTPAGSYAQTVTYTVVANF